MPRPQPPPAVEPAASSSSRRYRGTQPEQRRAERRERLLEAALELYGREGYHGATVRAICAQAQLTERYFYESFPHGEALLAAVYSRGIERVTQHVIAALGHAGADIAAQSRAALQAYFSLMREDPRLARVLFVEVLGVSPELDRAYRRATFGFASLLLGIAQKNTELTLRDAAQGEWISAGLIGAVIVITHRWMLSEFKQPQEDVVAACMDIFGGTLRQLQSSA